MHQRLSGLRAARVFLCFAAGYLLSYALRAINAVIAPALVADLGLSNADLGLLSSAYFLSFATLQLPLGVWLDRYGARRTESALLLCAAAGAALFASSHSLTGLWCGRALIGVGVSACLMAAFQAYRQWFAVERQSQLASWMLVAGTSGALSATLPVTLALPLIGWRGVFWIVAAALVLVSAAIFFLLADVERQFRQPAATGAAGVGYGQIFGSRLFWRFGLVGLANHGTFFAIQTLWAGPWLATVLGKSSAATSSLLFVLNAVLMLSYLALGWAAPRLARRSEAVMALGLAGALLAQLLLISTGSAGTWLTLLLLALCVPVTTLVQSHAALAFPAALSGRANTAYNLMLFVGAFAAQWGIGVLADLAAARGAGPADALRWAFAICLAVQTAAFVQFLVQRPRPATDSSINV